MSAGVDPRRGGPIPVVEGDGNNAGGRVLTWQWR
jgi:hypothetical protein